MYAHLFIYCLLLLVKFIRGNVYALLSILYYFIYVLKLRQERVSPSADPFTLNSLTLLLLLLLQCRAFLVKQHAQLDPETFFVPLNYV